MNQTSSCITTEKTPQSPLMQNSVKNVDVKYVEVNGLKIDAVFKTFIEDDVIPGTDINSEKFWLGFSALIKELVPKNQALLKERDTLQKRIDQWHIAHNGEEFNKSEYREFLQNIGYIAPRVGDFSITTQNVDAEIAHQAGPQLVVPLKNARFALNAANARWGSLYDALYGTDAIDEADGCEKGETYNAQRGQKVIARARDFLEQAIPLTDGSHADACQYRIVDGELKITLEQGKEVTLRDPEQCLGFSGDKENPSALLIVNNGLRFEIQIDHNSEIGRLDKAGIKDILMESALTTIMDCEDSVAAVDAEDKLEVYQNWLGLMKGTLSTTFKKVDRNNMSHIVERSLSDDRVYTGLNGKEITLSGRSLLFIRNVGHLMTNPTILDNDGQEIPEGILDGVVTSLIALHDLKGNSAYCNSQEKSIYIVKPKMHGPEEVAFSDLLFSRIETLLELDHETIKMGIMDEERRTTLSLKACIKQAKGRVVFINTGFLDRTGDEIHTSMHMGPMVPKMQMKAQPWIQAYEQWNVDVGLDCGLSGKAQIGKGMWPMPDRMADMLKTKINHPESGANTAWVPSPTAATLHSMHYHICNVFSQQKMIEDRINRDAELCFDTLLEIPCLVDKTKLTPEIIRAEIDNNCQGILGYVVRWIDQGVGCSKVPDINNIGLMEDRATLRISSQHLANWLCHGICSKEDVEDALVRMANVVDEQNKQDPQYQAMTENLAESIAFRAASDLIFLGAAQPNGYTEPLLHGYRQQKKCAIEKCS